MFRFCALSCALLITLAMAIMQFCVALSSCLAILTAFMLCQLTSGTFHYKFKLMDFNLNANLTGMTSLP